MRDIAAEKTANFVSSMVWARKRRGLTQSQLAERLGISRMVLTNLETGRKPIRLDEALRLCEVLETPLQTMISY